MKVIEGTLFVYGALCFFFSILGPVYLGLEIETTPDWRLTWRWVILIVVFLPATLFVVLISILAGIGEWVWDGLDIPIGGAR